jgi:hypothetical protein
MLTVLGAEEMLRERSELPVTLLSAADVTDVGGSTTLGTDELLPETQRVRPLQSYRVLATGVTIIDPVALPDWIPEFLEIASRLRALRDGWDSYHGQRIHAEAIRRALAVLVSLDITARQLPSFVPMSTGGIQLEWHTLAGDTEIVIHPNGRVSAYCNVDQDGSEWEAEELTDFGLLRSKVASILTDES